MTKFTFVDLFCGIGGFHVGLSQCGGECVMACDNNVFAQQSYKANFGIAPLGDIYQIDSKNIADFDLLCAGFPCQAFSNVGQKGGFNDPRGILIFEVIRVLTAKKPKAFILENVMGLLHHDNGHTFETIKQILINCGYRIEYKVLCAKDFGLPQLRRRVFIVGIRNDINIKFVFPEPIGCEKLLGDVLNGTTRRDYAFTIRIGGRHSGINNKYNWDSYYLNDEVHVLSINECLSLQGFPPNFTLCGNSVEQFKQVGNSVPTNIVKAIGKQLVATGLFL